MNLCKLPLIVLCGLGAALTSSATVVWSESFDGATNGSIPYTDYNNNGSNDWTLTNASETSSALVNTSIGSGSPSLHILDTGTGNAVSAQLNLNQATPFTTSVASTSTIKVSFDWRIDSFTASSTAVPRFALRGNGSTLLNIGFGRTNLADGDGNNDLMFFASAGAAGNPSASSAIGFTGTGWDAGFDFGDYSNTGSENNTLSEANPNGFLHFEITYVDQATTAEISISYGFFSTTYTLTGLTPASFSNTGSNSFTISAPGAGMAEMYFDNITVSAFAAIPEPASATLLMAGAGLIGVALFRRRRG